VIARSSLSRPFFITGGNGLNWGRLSYLSPSFSSIPRPPIWPDLWLKLLDIREREELSIGGNSGDSGGNSAFPRRRLRKYARMTKATPIIRTNAPTVIQVRTSYVGRCLKRNIWREYIRPAETPMIVAVLLCPAETLVKPFSFTTLPLESVPPVPALPPIPEPESCPIAELVDNVSGAAETNVRSVDGVMVESRAWKIDVDFCDSSDEVADTTEAAGRDEAIDKRDVMGKLEDDESGACVAAAAEEERPTLDTTPGIVVPVAEPAATDIGPAPTPKSVPVGLTATDIDPAPTPSRVPVGLTTADIDPAPTLNNAPVGSTATDNGPAPTPRRVPVGLIAADIDPASTPSSVPVGLTATDTGPAPTAKSVPVGSIAADIGPAPTPRTVPVGSTATETGPASTPRIVPVGATPTDKTGSDAGPTPAPIRGPELGATPTVRSPPTPSPKSAPSEVGVGVVSTPSEVGDGALAGSGSFVFPKSPPKSPLSEELEEATSVGAAASDVVDGGGASDIGSFPSPRSPPSSPGSPVLADTAAEVVSVPPPRIPPNKAALGELKCPPVGTPNSPSSKPIRSACRLHKCNFIPRD